VAESNWQIKRMEDIYQSAGRTFICFGDDDADTSLVADILRRLPPVPNSALTGTSVLQRCEQEIF
jgi:hypothetical protein